MFLLSSASQIAVFRNRIAVFRNRIAVFRNRIAVFRNLGCSDRRHGLARVSRNIRT
jgi:hypothetical protein